MDWLFDHIRPLLGRAVSAALVLAIVAPACTFSAEDAKNRAAGADANSLAGQLLVAAPGMPDPRFAKTVIFMVHHGSNGAMGLVVNHVLGVDSAARLLEGAGVGVKDIDRDAKVRVHYGGPVQPRRGFVLHTGDYAEESTVAVTDRVSMTAASKILRAIARGKGPDKKILAVGYAGWAAGQLEGEIARKDWVVVASDDRLVFDSDMASKWRRAMDRHGVEL
jgi:putative transcriptional regulator